METCRICYEPNDLINVCRCSGTVGMVHLKCIQEWIRVSKKDTCEICKTEYVHDKITSYNTIVSKKLGIYSFMTFVFGILNGLTAWIDVYYGHAVGWTAAINAFLFNSAQLVLAVAMRSERSRYWKIHVSFYIGFVISTIPGLLLNDEVRVHIFYSYMFNTLLVTLFLWSEVQSNRTRLVHN